jgi:hypothetical protein
MHRDLFGALTMENRKSHRPDATAQMQLRS